MFNRKSKQIKELQKQVALINTKNNVLSSNLKLSQSLIKTLENDIKSKNDKISELLIELSEKQDVISRLEEVNTDKQQEVLNNLKQEIQEKQSILSDINDKIYIQHIGLYEPVFRLNTSQEYKDKIKEIRKQQKQCIKRGRAIIKPRMGEVAINDSTNKGSNFVKFASDCFLLGFNLSCEGIIDKCTAFNIEQSRAKIEDIFNNINLGGQIVCISISDEYKQLKLDELQCAFEYQMKLQEEKEEKRQQAEIVKEQKKVEQELAKAKEKLEKELEHYENQVDSKDWEVQCVAINKVAEIKEQLESCDYRLANCKAGYVYIIHNPSLGNNVYKIGVTRRLDPMERVDELSNASVPFRFSPNAIIFSEDAFALESALHKEFEQYKVNKINGRKEFFELPIEQIEKTVKEKFAPNADFELYPINEQYELSKNV